MREKDQMLHFRVSKAELDIIRQKMQEVGVPSSDDCLCRSFSPGKAVQQSLWVYPQSTDSVPFRMRGLYGDLAAMESGAAVGNDRIALHFGVVWLRSDRNHI